MTTNCTKDCPHKAAYNDGPWQSFANYAQARAFVDRKVKRPTDTSWIRCAIHEPTPSEVDALIRQAR